MTDGKQVWKKIVVGTTGGALALHHLCAPPTYLFFCIISNIEQFTEGNLTKYASSFSDRANKESTIKMSWCMISGLLTILWRYLSSVRRAIVSYSNRNWWTEMGGKKPRKSKCDRGVNLYRRSYPRHTWQHCMPKYGIEGGVFFLSRFVTRSKPAVLMMFLSLSLNVFVV